MPELTPTAVMDAPLQKTGPIGTESLCRGPSRVELAPSAKPSRKKNGDEKGENRDHPGRHQPHEGGAAHLRPTGATGWRQLSQGHLQV
jgi:hypothetical protein